MNEYELLTRREKGLTNCKLFKLLYLDIRRISEFNDVESAVWKVNLQRGRGFIGHRLARRHRKAERFLGLRDGIAVDESKRR